MYTSGDTHSENESEVIKGKVTSKFMTPYEYAALLQYRVKQLTKGKPPVIEWTPPFDAFEIAQKEIKERADLRLFVIRNIPDASTPLGYREEVWDPRIMNIRDH